MLKHLAIAAVLVLPMTAMAGDIVEMGANQYSVSKTSAACGLGGTGSIKTALYKQISKFCAAKSLSSEVTNIQEQDGVIGRRCARATIEFRCVNAGEVSTAPTGRSPDRDMNHSPGVAADRGQFGHNGSAQPTQSASDRYEALAKLKGLLDSGAITQAEYDAEKRRLLRGP